MSHQSTDAPTTEKSLVENLLVNPAAWLLPLFAWSCLVGWSYWLTKESITEQSTQIARIGAQNMFRMIQLTRLWNANHGGIYVPVTEQSPPNPYLSDVPERDIVTVDNRRFTLINPAYMTRQISELSAKEGVLFHITSLNPIRPTNKPDPWESEALKQFALGSEEVAGRTRYQGVDVFRYMAPLTTKRSCLKCHKKQGYRVGDIRGGISVTLASEPIFGGDAGQAGQAANQHIIAYLLVSALLILFLMQLRRHWLNRKHIEHRQQRIIAERTRELLESNLRLQQENKEREAAERLTKQEREFLQMTVDGIDDAVLVISPEFDVVLMNRAARAFSEQDPLAKEMKCYQLTHNKRAPCSDTGVTCPMELVIKNRGKAKTIHRLTNPSGGKRIYELVATPLWNEDGSLKYVIETTRDITEHLEIVDQLHDKEIRLDHVAHHDPVTNLPNRQLLMDRLSHSIHQASRSEQQLALIFIDLDRFKQINDSLGHTTGDQLLNNFAQRLQQYIRKVDTVAHLGADEFIILLDALDHSENAAVVAQKLITSFESPFLIDGNELYLSASIGISLYPQDGMHAETLLRNADAAMHKAKEDGRSTFHFYTEDMTELAYNRVFLEADLRKSLEEKSGFEVFYQPQLNLETNTITGVEALVRWHRNGDTLVPPAMFIPLAEETGLIQPLGEWVLRESCRQMKEWKEKQVVGESMKLSVNLSAKQLQLADLPQRILDILAETRLEPSALELEITESFIMNNPEKAAAIFQKLRNYGIDLAIDDFGTGYSSLAYLKRLPITKLKIDRSFVYDIPHDPNDEAIAKAVIALGKSLQLKVIAEGIETKEQEEFLRREGCNCGQGYFYSRPIPADKFQAFVLSYSEGN